MVKQEPSAYFLLCLQCLIWCLPPSRFPVSISDKIWSIKELWTRSWGQHLLGSFVHLFIHPPSVYWGPSICQRLVLVTEKAMAPHSSTFAWKIPWTEEPGGLQSMGSLGVGHDWATSLSLFTFMHWKRKWQPTPVFLPRESQRWGSLVGCHLWGRTESNMTEAT